MPETFLERGKRVNAGRADLDHKQYYPEEPEAVWVDQTVQTTSALAEARAIDPRGSLSVEFDMATPGAATGTIEVWVWNDAAGTFFKASEYTFDSVESGVLRVDVAGRKFQPLLTAITASAPELEKMSMWVVRL